MEDYIDYHDNDIHCISLQVIPSGGVLGLAHKFQPCDYIAGYIINIMDYKKCVPPFYYSAWPALQDSHQNVMMNCVIIFC